VYSCEVGAKFGIAEEDEYHPPPIPSEGHTCLEYYVWPRLPTTDIIRLVVLLSGRRTLTRQAVHDRLGSRVLNLLTVRFQRNGSFHTIAMFVLAGFPIAYGLI
jgi:hypothetical protein